MAIELNVPESLNEITLKQYQKWVKITEGKDMNNFYQQKMIEIFCNAKLIDVLRIKAKDINVISLELDNLFKDNEPFTPTFRMGDKEFGFIPKLDDMTFGEYVDLDNYFNEWETMDKAMGVLYRPITLKRKGQYVIEEYETANKYNMGEMPLGIVMSSLLFFWNLKNELLTHIVNYLQKEGAKSLPPHLIASLKNGDGFNPFTASVKEILETYQK
tara:strand:- start:161 stop:805 length:645 start_codon:yes stop_codon:yes gene_type:complete